MKLSKSQESVILSRLAGGELGFVGEWRGATVEHIKWDARPATVTEKARPAGEMWFVGHTIEVGDDSSLRSYSVRVRLEAAPPPGFQVSSSFSKGDLVWVPLETFYREKGVATVEAREIVVLPIESVSSKAA